MLKVLFSHLGQPPGQPFRVIHGRAPGHEAAPLSFRGAALTDRGRLHQRPWPVDCNFFQLGEAGAEPEHWIS